jgi:hypothetical protein
VGGTQPFANTAAHGKVAPKAAFQGANGGLGRFNLDTVVHYDHASTRHQVKAKNAPGSLAHSSQSAAR